MSNAPRYLLAITYTDGFSENIYFATLEGMRIYYDDAYNLEEAARVECYDTHKTADNGYAERIDFN